MSQKIIILVIIIIIKGIFSAADTAFTYINKAKVSQMSKKDKKSKRIKKMLENHNKFYGVIEVGITMAELFATVLTAETFINELVRVFGKQNISYDIAVIISTILVTIGLSYFLLVFGTILPKRIARNHPEKTAYRLINTLDWMAKINYPFEKIISVSTNIICSIFGIPKNQKDTLTEKEIKMIIAEGKDQGVIDNIEKEIAFNALKFESTLVKNIMLPKERIDFINIEDNIEDILANIKNYNYTRMPVYSQNEDNVIGIFNIKDIAIEYAKNKQLNWDLNKILRKVIFVRKDEKISDVFKMMQLNNQAMVIVVDEKKKVVGLVTMEDILEKLVGPIFDEYDKSI